MCGRFALKTPSARVAELMHFDNTPAITERYNIAPSQEILAVREVAGRREGCMMRWGLIPSWAKDPAIGNRMINARAESLAEKPSFRESFRHRRCLIPADGFYEWQEGGGRGRSKQPYFIHRSDGQIMALAGIWDHWISPDGEEVLSCAIITIDAGPDVAAIHSRMPVIIQPSAFDLWLGESIDLDHLTSLLAQLPESSLAAYRVDHRVNKPEADSPECIEPIKFHPSSKSELF